MKKAFFPGLIAALLLMWLPVTLTAQKGNDKYDLVYHSSPDGKFNYFSVTNDPLNSRVYTLKNGLTVFLTVNKAEPRIYTMIPVRAGSKNDPADATGLAHYLEHMLFKGTDKYGTSDYAKEKPLLDEIEKLYEKYRKTSDEAKRKEIYREIDRVSGEAAKYAIANEYDKMLSAIGAKGTNAYTSFEQTVYINDIPSNQLEKWLRIESERFRNPVLRLFHTELEAVYEEKNISLDNDGRAAWTALFETIFPTHNYGQQTTIGTIDHLKNPSIKKIKAYYENYYVPNNMAICLSGDFDPDETIRLIDKYFGFYESSPVAPYDSPKEEAIKEILEVEVKGPEAESIILGYRLPGLGNPDTDVMELIDMILSNSKAGLIDINLNQQQKVLRAYSFPMTLTDYSVHMLSGNPKEGQSLEEVRDLLLAQIKKIKAGDFDETLLPAIVNNMEIEKMEAYENNRARASEFVEAFTTRQEWIDYVQRIERMRKITKEDVVRVANRYYNDNYVVVYKRKGERVTKKVEKPEITPVEVNRDSRSPFLADLVETKAADMSPRFLNYDQDILKGTLESGLPFQYIHNGENSLFTLYYVLDLGKMHDKKLAFAINYLPFLGTSKYSADEISRKMYNLGLSYNVFAGKDQVYVYLSGLDANLREGLELFEHLLADAQPDEAALRSLVDRTLKSRADAKLNRRAILWNGMFNYGMYGPQNPFTDILSEKELRDIKASDLTDKIHALTSYEHRVMYYGPASMDRVTSMLNASHEVPGQRKAVPTNNPYTYRSADKPKVYFVHYDDMVQAEILWLRPSVKYDPDMTPEVRFFNEYYGGGMSSIVFQTIRESKALAYSTFAGFSSPDIKGDPYFIRAYVGTQADKLHDAMAGMIELLTEVPRSDNMIDAAKNAIRNKIETERIIRTSIFFDYMDAQRLGVDHDLRKDVYQQVSKMDFETVRKFHESYIKGQNFNIMILGSRDKVDVKSLEKYGEVVELKLEDLFGY